MKRNVQGANINWMEEKRGKMQLPGGIPFFYLRATTIGPIVGA